MIIIHKITDFLYDLFPKAKYGGKNIDVLKEELEKFYTYGVYKPTVEVDSDTIQISIDVPKILNQKPEYDKVISFCERRKFSEAKPIIQKLIKDNPTNSEYHRILGQIFSEMGNQDEAINSLIDALRWDPKNGYALIMMGNIFAREKDDIDTAMKYFNEAINQNLKDNIAINNLATNLIQMGKWEEGMKYFQKAYELNPDYPNTNYALALSNERLGNKLEAFNYAISAIKRCGIHDKELLNHSISLATEISKAWIKTDSGKKAFNKYKSYLEIQTDKSIKVEIDETIPTAAKIEFAENYDRDYHVIKYRPEYIAVDHLMMHELVHLDFATQARKEKKNKLFITTNDKKQSFIKDNSKQIQRLSKEGYPENQISNYISALFDGINRQIYNTPIDLFIEDFLYKEYPELRPFQFLSLYRLVIEGKEAVTQKRSKELTPREILSISKILNIVNALHFKDVYGYDLVSKFEATPLESNQAKSFYEEFLEYRKDRDQGEEYELVQHWGEDLKIDKYFELVDEEQYRNKRTDIDGLISSIEKDPFGLESDKELKDKETDTFLKSAQEIGTNMAVVMFMVDAMQHFKSLSKEKIKEIALEIAMVGTQGINPAKHSGYKLTNVPKKDFSGYHLLAYYYVSWSQAIPEMVSKLNLPYEKEYEMAKQFYSSGT